MYLITYLQIFILKSINAFTYLSIVEIESKSLVFILELLRMLMSNTPLGVTIYSSSITLIKLFLLLGNSFLYTPATISPLLVQNVTHTQIMCFA